MRIPSKGALAEELAGGGDYRRICGFRRVTPSRGCLTYFRSKSMGGELFKEALEAMVEQAIAYGAVKGLAIGLIQQLLRLIAPEMPQIRGGCLMLEGLEEHIF
jgi:hypothetical protein